MITNKALCPCHSKLSYEHCCMPYHKGKIAGDALILMRSRYAAYALGLADYIMQTTHLDLAKPSKEWEQEIVNFSKNTEFVGLTIEYFEEKRAEAIVIFFAKLKQKDQDISFREESHFVKVNNKWLYLKGIPKS